MINLDCVIHYLDHNKSENGAASLPNNHALHKAKDSRASGDGYNINLIH